MSTDDSEQPGDLAHLHDSTTHEPSQQTPLALERAPISTDDSGTPITTTPKTPSPSPAPHITPAVDVALTGPPAQAEQPPEGPPTLVNMGATQTAPAQPPTPITSPAAPNTPNTPTPPPLPAVIAAHPPTQQRRSRIRSVLALIGTICIVALLASGSYFIFNLLNSHTEGDVAHIVPSSTVALISIDLVAAAAHGQRITAGDLGNAIGQSDSFKLLTGLDWDKDILPWVGRDMAFTIFQRQPPSRSPNASQGPSAANVNDTIGGAFLLQSRDDAAAQTAIRKAANYQQSQGLNLVSLDYRGLTLYHASLLQGDESGTTLAAGKGWAVVAGDLPGARVLVDSLTGNSSAEDTLAATSAYHDAVGSLPANRFGTLFLNTRALAKGFVYGGSSQTDMASALANTYPVAVGYLAWTSDGLQAQLTFPSARNLDVGTLTGDTTTLANLTPADAFAYVGVANVGAMLHAQNALTAHGTPATGTATAFFDLAPTDPALQQPAAISLIGEPRGATGYLALLTAPDRADALAMVGQAAEHKHWTSQTTTVDGLSVTAYYERLSPAQNTATAATVTRTTSAATTPPMRLIGMETWLDNTLIFASDTTVMTDAVHTIRDHAPNLATNTRFQQLVREAPAGACATTFLDLSRAATSGDAVTSVIAAGLAARIPALLVTHLWNDSHYQVTADLLLPK